MKQLTKQMQKLDFIQTEKGIKLIKDSFERALALKLRLQRVTAPKFLVAETGLQDDLAGTQVPVSFKITHLGKTVEIVHSLAKWKRHMLGKHCFKQGAGLYTDMDAIRKDEALDETHSIYVDQWDWELVISKEQRTIGFLKEIVQKIYGAILETEAVVEKEFPSLKATLPREITFVHSEELEKSYPSLSSAQREDKIAKKYGAVFLIGIGHPLKSGKPHDLRAADYDDWSTETTEGKHGLCGDIIVWDSVRQKALELSSMGIRVDKSALLKQLEMAGLMERLRFGFHKGIVDGAVPLTIGGGIGQSRLCMLLLQKSHIGEVQSSVWGDSAEEESEQKGIKLL